MTNSGQQDGPDLPLKDVLFVLRGRQSEIGHLLRAFEAAALGDRQCSPAPELDLKAAQQFDLALQLVDDVEAVLTLLSGVSAGETRLDLHALGQVVKLEAVRESFWLDVASRDPAGKRPDHPIPPVDLF